MQQPLGYEVSMGETRNAKRKRSLTPTHFQQNLRMRYYHPVSLSESLRTIIGYLLRIPYFRIARFVQQVLSFLIGEFVIALFFKRRQAAQPGTTVTLQQTATLAPKQTNSELVPADLLKDQFLNMASHELKTPMTTIRGHVQLVLRKLAKQSEMPADLTIIHTALEQIDTQTRRLNSLVDQLLELENIRAGKVALRLQPCDLVSLCREVIEGQSLLTGRMIELHAPSAPVILQADCDRLVQVLVNLISNAIKYSPDESKVKVQVSKHNDVAVIQVIDNGPGIAKSQQAHIFKPFYRGPDVRSTPIDGLGLGLTICKDIVEQHHGHIWCHSYEGAGSTFFVELPLY